jgi:hypothetical protein
MICTDFRTQHLAWLDAALAAAEAAEMRAHADACSHCGRYDAEVRVGLLMARHLQPIRVSPDFQARLKARLDFERFAVGQIHPATAGNSGQMIA